jgi:hypothetical protein
MGGRQLSTIILCSLVWVGYANTSAHASWFGPRSLPECVEEKMENLARSNEDGTAVALLTIVATRNVTMLIIQRQRDDCWRSEPSMETSHSACGLPRQANRPEMAGRSAGTVSNW